MPALKIIFIFLLICNLLKYYNKNAKYIFFNAKINKIKRKYRKRFSYTKLKQSNVYVKLKRNFNSKLPSFNFLKFSAKDKNYLLSVSKLLDYKINNNHKTFRATNKTTLIELVANKLTENFVNSNHPNIFKSYNQLKDKFKIQKKEKKILRILISKYLLLNLINVLNNISKLDSIIQKAKVTSRVKKYKNINYMQAEYYGIIKYNPNSTLLIEKYNIKKSFNFNLLLSYLHRCNLSLKYTIHYLKIMFD